MEAEQVAKCRDIIASDLTPADLARVQERARSIRDLLDADRAEAWFKAPKIISGWLRAGDPGPPSVWRLLFKRMPRAGNLMLYSL